MNEARPAALERAFDGPVGVGVIGLGFMGRTHVQAYAKADAAGWANRLVAVCDQDPERRAGRAGGAGNLEDEAPEQVFDPAGVLATAEAEELLACDEVELVSICTHTDTHVDLALRALAAGKHCLVEKPVALRSEDVARLADAAAEASTLCMPAHCMRFWPAWEWLRERVRDGSLGAVRGATFRRLGSRPDWAAGFYDDPARSGGALVDLHIHDADFVRWCFGDPQAVTSAGTVDHLSTLYHFDGGPAHVTAEGGWDNAPGWGFRMQATVVFEQATADFDISRAPQLELSGPGGVEAVEVGDCDGYDGEVRHLLGLIAAGGGDLRVEVDDARALASLLEAERRSLASGATEPV
ncbi:MAG: Gfo/Idh/MocA family oxidoreductase [Planctomycetota bacterium]|jgi:predicted dehydrogenase|nr:Gfo/Idh/MocA family oxidoreductase [Planctomycetota bacterium]MDP6762458.1 Gfo/Idh/MocA family oxidoreductase [Planctomycetota bacterium]MDP6989274.1 Gfo/Idh/MocA family oxidoreductase [Planctomycetota bacterium]